MIKRFGVLAFLFFFGLSFAAHAGNLVNLVPQGAAFLFDINLSKLVSTEAIKKQIDEGLAKQTPEQKKAFDEFIAKTGINPLKDITDVFIFVFPPDAAKKDGQTNDAGVIINGTFNVAKILDSIKADKKAAQDVSIEKFEGLDCIKAKNKDEGMAVFLDQNTALVGTPNAIKSVIDVKNSKGKNILGNEAFGKILKKADTSASIWGVGLIPETLKAKAKENPQSAPLAALNALFFSFNYDKNLTFNFTGEADKTENMEQIMTTLNGFMAMLKMVAGQTPEAAEVLNMIKVESSGTTAQISLNVSKETLDQLKKKVEERMKAPPKAPDK